MIAKREMRICQERLESFNLISTISNMHGISHVLPRGLFLAQVHDASNYLERPIAKAAYFMAFRAYTNRPEQ
jgi:hypothetical protein